MTARASHRSRCQQVLTVHTSGVTALTMSTDSVVNGSGDTTLAEQDRDQVQLDLVGHERVSGPPRPGTGPQTTAQP